MGVTVIGRLHRSSPRPIQTHENEDSSTKCTNLVHGEDILLPSLNIAYYFNPL